MKLVFSFFALLKANPLNERVCRDAVDKIADVSREEHEDFARFVNARDDALFEFAWEYCHEVNELEYDASLDMDELAHCGTALWDEIGALMYGGKYPHLGQVLFSLWNVADWDGSGLVDFDEFRFTETMLAGVYALVAYERHDRNGDRDFDLEEVSEFEHDLMPEGEEFGNERAKTFHELWKEAELFGDYEKTFIPEVALFFLEFWRMMLEN